MDQTIQGLKIVLPAIGFIPVAGEYLKSSLELVVTLYELGQKVESNQDDLTNLIAHASRLLANVIIIADKIDDGLLKESAPRLHELKNVLEEILQLTKDLQKVNHPGQVWNASKTAARIVELRQKLDNAVEIFTVTSNINTMNDTNILKKELEEVKRKLDAREQESALKHAEKGRLSALQPVHSARHDNKDAQRPGCLESTRVALLADIFKWIEAEDAEDCIHWLVGLGGTGKSTIAQTVSEQLAASSPSKLAASFFFSRYLDDRKIPANVIRTIAYHLASLTSQLKSLISEVLRENPDITLRSIQDQAKHLLVYPLSRATDLPSPIVFVFDALDECEGNGTELMAVLANALIHSLPNLRVKIFVTSRLEPAIQSMFDSIPHKPYKLHDIDASIVGEDIKAYYIHSFERIRHRQRDPSLASWPSADDISTLVERARGLFIFAATVIKYIDVGAPPAPRLRLLLSTNNAQDGRYKMLDDLYLQVLRSAIDPNLDTASQGLQRTNLQNIIATIAILQDPLPPYALAQLLDLGFSETLNALRKLSAVLLLPDQLSAESAEVVRLLHPSFQDFVFDPKRCIDWRFQADISKQHTLSAQRCLDIMLAGLKRDICGIRDPSLQNSEVPGISSRITQLIPRELAYACRFWIEHLQQASFDATDSLDSLVEFCEKRLLEWIECCSLLNILPGALSGLRSLYRKISTSHMLTRIASLLRDTERLIMEFYFPISTSALHVYYSAAPLLPQCLLFELVSAKEQNFPQLLLRRSKAWNPMLQTIEGHPHGIMSLVISSDGLHLVSGARDSTIRIWDAWTGAFAAQIDTPTRRVDVVAVSPDRTRIASGSTSGTVYIWDAITYSLISELHGHNDVIRAAAFSPDSSLLVSGSNDATIRIWDVHHNTETMKLEGHTGHTSAATFSHDGSFIIYSAGDHSIRVWDLKSGDISKRLDGHSRSITSAVLTTDDLQLVSASDDYTIRVWSIETGEQLSSLVGHTDKVKCVALTPDGSRIVSGSLDKTIRIWSMKTCVCLSVLSGHSVSVRSVVISPNGSHLFSASEDRTLRVWDLTTPDTKDTLPPSDLMPDNLNGKQKRRHKLRARISSAALDIKQAFTDVRDNGVQLVRSIQRSINPYMTDLETTGNVVSFDISPDDMYIVTSHGDHSINIWEQSGGRLIRSHSSHSDAVNSVIFSSDSSWIIAGLADGTVRAWETKTGKSLATMEGHMGGVRSVAISPDQKMVASGSGDGTVRLWYTNGWFPSYTLRGHESWVNPVAFSSDNSRVASGSGDSTVRIWNTATGNYISILTGGWHIYHVVFCRGDSQVGAIDGLGISHTWDLQSNDFSKLEDTPPSTFFFDTTGWLWGPVIPNGPVRRICWLPKSRRRRAPNHYQCAVRADTLATISDEGLVTYLDISCLFNLFLELYSTS